MEAVQVARRVNRVLHQRPSLMAVACMLVFMPHPVGMQGGSVQIKDSRSRRARRGYALVSLRDKRGSIKSHTAQQPAIPHSSHFFACASGLLETASPRRTGAILSLEIFLLLAYSAALIKTSRPASADNQPCRPELLLRVRRSLLRVRRLATAQQLIWFESYQEYEVSHGG